MGQSITKLQSWQTLTTYLPEGEDAIGTLLLIHSRHTWVGWLYRSYIPDRETALAYWKEIRES